jgi:hypothetical protein
VSVRFSTSVPAFVLAAVIVLVTPMAWQVILARFGPDAGGSPSYLPAIERTRVRRSFDTGVVPGLRAIDPGYVIIGDSMAGRVHFNRLRDLTGERVAPILQNATGSAYWYLAFKNFVVPSGVKPKWTLVFFRDTNLTDPMFRLLDEYRSTLDEVALDREDELDRIVAARATGPWYTMHGVIDRVYGAERARAWLEPHVASWPARAVAGAARAPALLTRINDAFSLDHLRPMAQADLGAAADREADFASNVKTSVLPAFVTLARERGLRVCFIRVLRRPVDGAPPAESAALRQYVADLRAYLAAEGTCFLDDRDDPRLLSIQYEDGDHIKREETGRYTELLVERLAQIVR